MNVEQGFQVGDLKGIARRRGPLALAIAGAVFLAAIPLAALLPNRYQAFATLLVEPQTISKKLIEAGVAESDLNQRMHLMTMQILSRGRLSKIIDDLKLYPDESAKYTREQVIEMMREMIRVEPVLPEFDQAQGVRRSEVLEINTFRLFFEHENANTAATVANRLANDFIEEHIKERVQISGDTSDFIESELSRLGARIQEVEAQVARVKLENPGRLPDEFDANQRMLERLFESLRIAQRELAEAGSDEAFYRQQALVAGEATYSRNDADPVQRLQSLEALLTGYRSRGFTDKHPDVVAAMIEIAALRTKVGEGGSGSVSVVQANAQAEARRAALHVASSREQVEKLTRHIEEMQKQLAETPRVAEQLSALEREYKHLFESFQAFSQKRLEAGVAANMERRQKGEQVRVLEPAFPAPEPVAPRRLVILAVAAMLGLAIGAGSAVMLEGTDSSFHQASALQTAMRVPVLAAIPAIVLDADLAANRRRQFRFIAGYAAVAALVIGTSGIGYVWRNVLGQGAEEPAAATAPASPTAPAGQGGPPAVAPGIPAPASGGAAPAKP